MIPPELYWPPELLAAAMPEKYGHLIRPQVKEPEEARSRKGWAPVETLPGGCEVYRPRFGRPGLTAEGEAMSTEDAARLLYRTAIHEAGHPVIGRAMMTEMWGTCRVGPTIRCRTP